MSKKRYDHAISLNFSLKTDNEEPTPKEILEALRQKVLEIDEMNVCSYTEIFDTLDNEEE